VVAALPPGNAASTALAGMTARQRALVATDLLPQGLATNSVLAALEPDDARAVLNNMSDEQAAALLAGGQPALVTAVLRTMPSGHAESLLAALPEGLRLAVQQRLRSYRTRATELL
jgi:Mg/Co/Ni transporter MgtE